MGSLWAPFKLTFGARWLTFGAIWLTFEPIWFTFEAHWFTFGASGDKFSQFEYNLALFLIYFIFEEIIYQSLFFLKIVAVIGVWTDCINVSHHEIEMNRWGRRHEAEPLNSCELLQF